MCTSIHERTCTYITHIWEAVDFTVFGVTDSSEKMIGVGSNLKTHPSFVAPFSYLLRVHKLVRVSEWKMKNKKIGTLLSLSQMGARQRNKPGARSGTLFPREVGLQSLFFLLQKSSFCFCVYVYSYVLRGKYSRRCCSGLGATEKWMLIFFCWSLWITLTAEKIGVQCTLKRRKKILYHCSTSADITYSSWQEKKKFDLIQKGKQSHE